MPRNNQVITFSKKGQEIKPATACCGFYPQSCIGLTLGNRQADGKVIIHFNIIPFYFMCSDSHGV